VCHNSLIDVTMTRFDRFKQRIAAQPVLCIHVGTRDQQQLHGQAVALAGCQHKAAAAIIVAAPYTAALLQHLRTTSHTDSAARALMCRGGKLQVVKR